jgi:hypothetical protein
MLLAAAERRLQLADRLAAVILDPRDPDRVTHGVADIIRTRILAIACGYEDGNDHDRPHSDPAFKLAFRRRIVLGHFVRMAVDTSAMAFDCSRLALDMPLIRSALSLSEPNMNPDISLRTGLLQMDGPVFLVALARAHQPRLSPSYS